jgi:hypothetical protein
MKTAISLILTSMLGAAICILLIQIGVLQVRPGTDPAYPALLARTTSDEQQSSIRPDPVEPSSHHHDAPSPVEDEDMHPRILAHLLASEQSGEAEVEDRFRGFLTDELGMSDEEVERFVRMSFWKGFVTQQQRWREEDLHRLRIEFEREKELKQAGFRAMGLPLMESAVREAEERLREPGERIPQAEPKGDSP